MDLELCCGEENISVKVVVFLFESDSHLFVKQIWGVEASPDCMKSAHDRAGKS